MISKRISETVKILTKLRDLGLPPEDEGYVLTKVALDLWIKTGIPSSQEIPFTSVNRVGHLDLPGDSQSIRFVLKATDILKARYASKTTKDNDMD